MLKFGMSKQNEPKPPKEAPYWYKDVKELIWWLLGAALIIWVSTKM